MSDRQLHGRLGVAVAGLIALTSTQGHTASGGQSLSDMANVPYVGCASDGQLGPQPPPKPSKPTPRLPVAVASRLAYYAATDYGVLAPRGWRCFSLYGSSGASVYVTPGAIDGRRLLGNDNFRFRGEAVEFSYMLGGTSGRFEVADISSRLFPIAHAYVNRVAREQKDIGGLPLQISGKPFPDDRIIRRTNMVVRLVTPPRKQGFGTNAKLAPNDAPIEGLAALIRAPGGFDLIELNIRLPQKDADLVSTIQSIAEANHGDPLSDTPLQEPGR